MRALESNAADQFLLGTYEILETTGAGGMGVVYRAMDTALGRVAAVKVLKDEFQAQSQLVARFRREAEAIATLNHPNIVRIYAVGESGTVPYLAMEFIEGRPLSEILEESGSLPWLDVLDLAIQVAGALACAHDSQIIHRDIKPANILVTDGGQVKVTDFGIAKVLNASTQLTVAGTRIGTPQYMCPERCRDLPITASSDLYSVGVLLYQCITGRLPFEARTSADLVSKISFEIPPRVRTFKPDVPEAVDRLVAHLLEKEARNRPPDARALADMIARVRRGEPLPPSASESLGVALATCRASVATPVSARTPALDRTTTKLRPSLIARIRQAWFDRSRGFRLGVAAVAVGLIAAGGVFAGRAVLDSAQARVASVAGRQDLDRWSGSGRLVQFRQETDTVFVGAFGLPDFAVDDLLWVPGAEGAVVHLSGLAGTERAGQQALLAVNPYMREASVSAPPHVAGDGLRLLAGGVFGSAGPGFVTAESGRAVIHSIRPAVPTVGLVAEGFYAGAADPAGGMMLLAAARGSAHELYLLDVGTAVSPQRLVALRAPVRAMAMHTATQNALVLSGDGEGAQTLQAVSFGLLRPEPAELERGDLGLHARAFRPDGAAFTYTGATGGQRRIFVRELAAGSAPLEAGAGLCVAWAPREGYLVAASPDHAGRVQLWAVQPEAPHYRHQLTYVESGVTPFFALAEEGGLVMAGIEGQNAILCLDLGPVAW